MRHSVRIRVAVALAGGAGALIAAPLVVAQVSGTWDLHWNAVSGGGGTSANDPYAVTGTIGQAAAGGPAIGDRFAVTGGFAAALGDIKYRLLLPMLSSER